MSHYDIFESPLGPVFVGGSGAGLHRVDFLGAPRDERACATLLERESGEAPTRDRATAAAAVRQLTEYFAGERTRFELPLAPRGMGFQLAVWEALRTVPYGETATYGEMAQVITRSGAARAVGAATGRNPLSVIVPCHRVVGADGTLTGYGGGLDRKAQLLALEARAGHAPRPGGYSST